MKPHLDQAITALEQELESHLQSVSELETALSALRSLAGQNGHARRPRRPANVRNTKRALKAERTNERAKRAPTGTRQRSLPDVTKDDAILDALREKSPQSPGELAKRLKLARPALTYQIKPLIKSGAVVATGHTGNRQFSLPSRSRAAKEAP